MFGNVKPIAAALQIVAGNPVRAFAEVSRWFDL